MPGSWTRLEVEATVADYFDMLEAELRGRSFNKTEHRRRLKPLLDGRSDGAIERKHQNVSAILIELGLPYIDGYKPLANYQRLLFEVVEDRVVARPDLIELVREQVEAEEIGVPAVEDILERLVASPATDAAAVRSGTARSRTFERPRRSSPRTVDYLAMEARNSRLGRAGEEFVVNFERARLVHGGREQLADRVEHVALTIGDGLGFDIRSFETDGSDRLIEVKTTAYGKETPFYVTANELTVSKRETGRYHLYRPFRFRTDPRLFTVPGALETTCALHPTEYRARVR